MPDQLYNRCDYTVSANNHNCQINPVLYNENVAHW